jgi:hypothetical protein
MAGMSKVYEDWRCSQRSLKVLHFLLLLFLLLRFAVLQFELRAYTLSHSTIPFL